VEGILNADPKEFPDTVKYNQLPYSETIEMSYYGASVLHPKTIKPLQNNKIPLFVKPFLAPYASGTLINDHDRAYYKIPVTIVKKNQVLISISPKDLSFIQGDHLSEIFSVLSKYKIKINVMQNSAISFSICADNDPAKINSFLKGLKKDYHLLSNENTQLITIRHYNEIAVNALTKNKKILLEQKSRGTVQFVVK
jgi:aspartate kinase